VTGTGAKGFAVYEASCRNIAGAVVLGETGAMTSTSASANATSLVHPTQLFHIGIVVKDLPAALLELSLGLGLTWKGGDPEVREVWLDGTARTLEMRIAHSVEGRPHFEVIEAIPGTPWEPADGVGVHHVCYWSNDSTQLCAELESRGFPRVMGRPGAGSGYFRAPSGVYIEILPRSRCDDMAAWLSS
jgi:catechol 2,3-dioxygenase-like lactoylglutathione lyase family enzyme